MLHSYAVTNFQSFRGRTEVDFTVSQRAPATDWIASDPSGERVSKATVVVGANASGKTALLKPLAFLGWFLNASFAQTQPGTPIPVSPHFASPNEPVEIECMAEFEGDLWHYQLRCSPQRVLHETLHRRHGKRFRYVFIRKWSEEKSAYTIQQQEFGLDAGKAAEVRPNVSLIAWAAQYGVPLALKLAAPIVNSNVTTGGRAQLGDLGIFQAGQKLFEDPSLLAAVQKLLCDWDLGLSGLSIQESEALPVPPSQNDPTIRSKYWLPVGQHFSHGQKYDLPFFLESNGTKSAFSLLTSLLPTLRNGCIAVIDELESDLHPLMIPAVLDLFASQRTNPHNAQLLFTSHSIEVLDLLGKEQVMLVEKNTDCESTALRLDQFSGVRADVSLYGKYMAGAFGAVPNL